MASTRVKRMLAGTALVVGAALVQIGLGVAVVIGVLTLAGGWDEVVAGSLLVLVGLLVVAVSISALRRLRGLPAT